MSRGEVAGMEAMLYSGLGITAVIQPILVLGVAAAIIVFQWTRA